MPLTVEHTRPIGRTQPSTMTPLWRWNGLMSAAERAQCCNQPDLAHALFVDAVGMAHQALTSATEDAEADAATAQTCVVAWVRSSLCLHEHLVDMGLDQDAAQTLAEAHAVLIDLVVRHPRSHAWHEIAAWHSRATHECLVGHWRDHGPHPDIERALRKACVPLLAHHTTAH